MEDIQQAVGRRIRELRVRSGLSQEELAQAAQSSRAHVSELEGGKVEAGLVVLGRLAGALGVEPVDLLKGAKAPRRLPVKALAKKNPPTPAERIGQLVVRLAKGRDDKTLKRFKTIARAFFEE